MSLLYAASKWLSLVLLPIMLLASPSGAHRAPLNVLVTIKPIHSLAAAILEGVSQPKLLLQGASSPHAYALKPSDGEALSDADVIIRVSENLEVFLDRAIRALPKNARVIDLDETPGLNLLPMRAGGLFEGHGHGGGGAADENGHDHAGQGYDPHFWLDPANAMKVADYLALQLSEIDPENAGRFKANAAALKLKLAVLDEELKSRLADVADRPFIVFHDVTQYMERRYGLRTAGAITVSPERQPGAGRLQAIRDKIRQLGAVCVFSEPQFPPKLIDALIEGSPARKGVLDEIGVEIPAGPDQYFALMRKDAESLAECLNR